MSSVFMCGCTDTAWCPRHQERATSCASAQLRERTLELSREVAQGLSRERALLRALVGYCAPEARARAIAESQAALGEVVEVVGPVDLPEPKP